MNRSSTRVAYATIAGWGYAVPRRVVTNLQLAETVDTTDEWIRTRTGITQRHIAGNEDSTATLAAEAARNALQSANCCARDVDLVIVATTTADYRTPSAASLVQDRIGAVNAGAFDLGAACSGFLYALAVASSMIAAGLHRAILVIGADTPSRLVDWSDPATCVLFGDGAGAVLLRHSAQPTGLQACVLGSDGSGAGSIYIPAGGSRVPVTAEQIETRQNFLKMKGGEVYRFAVQAMTSATQQVLQVAGLTVDNLDLFIPHQANLRIIQSACRALQIPPEKVVVNVDRYGNTSAASIPIALCEAVAAGRVSDGATLALVGFGAGLSWGAAIVRWGVAPALAPAAWPEETRPIGLERAVALR
jgi:3-oxoacyl-[acyl-carrier-protein] synthase III